MSLPTIEKDIIELVQLFDGRISYKIEKDEQVIEYNSHDIYQSASLIKIPMLVEGFRQVEKNKIAFTQHVPFIQGDVAGGSGVLSALSNSLHLTVKDLLVLMTIVSDNTATNMLISLLGMENINTCMDDLAMKNTMLQRRMMDLQAAADGRENITTAADIVTCLKAIHKGDELLSSSRQQILEIMEKQQFCDKLPAMMGNEVKIANKTGSLDGVSHDAAIIRYGSETVYAAILTDQISSSEESRQLISQIGKLIYDDLVE